MSERSHDAAGFALLALVVVLAVAAAATASFVAGLTFVSRADAQATAERDVARLARAVDEGLRRGVPAPVDVAGARALLPVDVVPERTTLEPWQPTPLRFTTSNGLTTLPSVGPDATPGTADDLSIAANVREAQRATTRGRLRVLRARIARSEFAGTVPMSNANRDAFAAALRAFGVAQRSIVHLSGGARASAIAARDAAIATITQQRAGPTAVVGPGGLCERLGLPDACGVDSAGMPFAMTEAGPVATGADRIGGTDDDL
jgi:type II secretory pathway pseudopilin PulG